MAEQIRRATVEAPADDVPQVVVDGDVVVDAGAAWTYQKPCACAVDVGGDEPGGRAKAVVRGSASVASEGLAMGVSSEACREDERSRAVVEHDVCVIGTAAWGVRQESCDPRYEYERLPVSEVSIGGNVDVCSHCDIARGIYGYAYGTTSCHVQGNVTVVNENGENEDWRHRSGKYPIKNLLDGHKVCAYDWEEYRSGCAYGIKVTNWGQTTVDVGGDICVTSNCGERCGSATGVEVGSFNGSTRIVVGGSIVARTDGDEDLGGEVKGIDVWRHDGGDVFVRTGGIDVEGYDPNSVGISAYSTSDSDIPAHIEVQVLGDMTSSGSGVILSSICRSLATPSICVLVDGTIRAGVNGVCVGRHEESCYDEATDSYLSRCVGEPWGSVDVVVWRIVVGEGRMAVQADEDVARCVSYLVRVEPPREGATIRILSDLEQRTFRGVPHVYSVAHAGDVIRFAVDVCEGYQLSAVYGIQDDEPLEPEPDGTYQVTVPPEGGIRIKVLS